LVEYEFGAAAADAGAAELPDRSPASLEKV
jgi:hypothetical protein